MTLFFFYVTARGDRSVSVANPSYSLSIMDFGGGNLLFLPNARDQSSLSKKKERLRSVTLVRGRRVHGVSTEINLTINQPSDLAP
jgi:hypothetical protein